MATTQLSDIQFDPDVYLSYVQENRPDRNAYIQSGVAVTNADLAARASGSGDITSVPYWKDLDASGENISSDDPTENATPDKIDTGRMVARRVHLNNGWQTANLVSSVMGSENPMQQIASRTAAYWDQRFAARIQAATLGIFNENAAGTGDMELWQQLANEITNHPITWKWVRGHNGNIYNERVDRIARNSIRGR